ncbi:MAG: hypothetical protein IJ907_04805 [Prevotella sp.]|nr:hypothetical protein [Prevotella sp.]
MKKYLFFAAALVAFASCSSDDFVGENNNSPNLNPAPASGEKAIVFNSGANAVTRSTHVGADAAAMLGNNFVVEGIKTVSGSPVEVFDNYNVNYTANSANKTASNTANWEYVGQDILTGKTAIYAQTIKYWDYAASQYDFWAYSLGGSSGVTVSSLDHDAAITTSAYTFTGTATQLKDVYISDLVTAYNPSVSGEPAFQDEVNLAFRALVAKIRVGLYETIPGYSVKNVLFYPSASGTPAATAVLYSANTDLPSSGECTVYFPTVGKSNAISSPKNSDYNKAHISFAAAGTKTANQSYGTLIYGTKESHEKTGTEFLKRTSAQPTWAVESGNSSGDYSVVLPNEDGTVLTLKVDYTLESTDGSGETITIHGAEAWVPAQYTRWKSNYAYTYIFKISDNTNGKTDLTNGPAGLYPITFDAVVIDSEDDTQETITTVSTPSITTYSITSDVTTTNEYKTSDVIYATTTENGSLITMTTDNTWLYKLTSSKTDYSAADVLEALNKYVSNTAGTIVGRNAVTLTPQTFTLTETELPLVDGNKITGLTAGQLAKFTCASAGTYAFVYQKTAPTATTAKAEYNVVSPQPAVGADVSSYYTTTDGDTYTACGASATAVAGTVYFSKIASSDYNVATGAVYGVKVIIVK